MLKKIFIISSLASILLWGVASPRNSPEDSSIDSSLPKNIHSASQSKIHQSADTEVGATGLSETTKTIPSVENQKIPESINPAEPEIHTDPIPTVGGYPVYLVEEVKANLTLEDGTEPTQEQTLAYLDQVNEKIHEANEELAKHIPEMRAYSKEQNWEALEKLTQTIYEKHVGEFTALNRNNENDYPVSWSQEQIKAHQKEKLDSHFNLVAP